MHGKAHEVKQSSTWRELVAVARVMESIATKLGGTRVPITKMWFAYCKWVVGKLTCKWKHLGCLNYVFNIRYT